MSLRVNDLEVQIQRLGKILPSEPPKGAKSVRPAAAKALPAEGGDDDDIDLFGSEDVSSLFINYRNVVSFWLNTS